MSTNHFNGLTEAEAERLAILAEECGEVIQAVGKILRHGYESTNPNKPVPLGKNPETNRWMLERELGDLKCVVRRMEAAEDINPYAITERSTLKPQLMKPYLHHQRGKA